MFYYTFGEEAALHEDNKLAENKLIILYLLSKMGVSLSNNDICQFALERNVMDYISVQQCLSELTDAKYLECTLKYGGAPKPEGSSV